MINGFKTRSGQDVTQESSLAVPTVYRCVDILANSVAKLPFQVFKEVKDVRSRDKKHAVYKLLERRPNSQQSPFIFKHTQEVHRLLWGNAYINIEWDMFGFPKALWLLNPAVTDVIEDPFTRKLWYTTTLPDGKPVFLKEEDVIHLKTLSLDGKKGKSMIQIARELIGSSQAAQQFKGAFFANGAMNSGFLKFPTPLNPDAKDVIRDEWQQKNAGIDNAHRVAILDAGLDFQSIGMPLKDAQFIEGMEYDKKAIATMFNVPVYKLNDMENSTLNNMEHMSIEFLSDSLDPVLTQYEEEFTYKLFSEKEQEKYYLEFELKKLMRTDSKTRTENYALMKQEGFLSINDVRRKENEPPIEGGDSYRVDLNHVDVKIADEYQLTMARGGLKGGEGKDNENTSKNDEPNSNNEPSEGGSSKEEPQSN
jgi:HK97 family phage portal protein